MRDFTGWLADNAPDIGPLEVGRDHVRGWLAHSRQTSSVNTARSRFAGVRHFHRWLVDEGERGDDPAHAVRMPPPGNTPTPVLTDDELRRLLGTCKGNDLRNRRDRAILMLFVDGGLRRSELADLTVDDIDLRQRIVYVLG